MRFSAIATLCSVLAPSLVAQSRPLTYPKTDTVLHLDRYHGTQVRNPFRWLEDDTASRRIAGRIRCSSASRHRVAMAVRA